MQSDVFLPAHAANIFNLFYITIKFFNVIIFMYDCKPVCLIHYVYTKAMDEISDGYPLCNLLIYPTT